MTFTYWPENSFYKNEEYKNEAPTFTLEKSIALEPNDFH